MSPQSPPARRPYVSLVIPCLDEARFIVGCLRSVLGQTWPRERTEILVVDGGSTDGTQDLVREVARLYPLARIRLLDNPDRVQSAGCNRAIRASRGDVVIRMDAHASYAKDYVEKCIEALEKTGADVVGGAQRAIDTGSWMQRAIAATLRSPLAVGGAAYRDPEAEGWVETVWLGAFRRKAFETVGLYDPCAAINEDGDLAMRITRSGGRLWLSRDIVAHYVPRPSLWALARQYFRYGFGRARTTRKHGELQTLRPLAPFGLVVSIVVLGALYGQLDLAASALHALGAVYVAALLWASAIVAYRAGGTFAPVALVALPLLHLAHGTGFALGLVRYSFAPDWPEEPERLRPRTLASLPPPDAEIAQQGAPGPA